MVIQHLTKQYGRKRVVDEVSFEIPQGQVLSLIGPNGAGKSTVMGMISRLVAKDAGLIHFEGQDLTKWNSRELSKRLAILTQSNNIQMKLTVRELVSFGRFPYCQGRLQPEDQEKSRPSAGFIWSWMRLPISLSMNCPAGSGSGR